MRNKNSNLQQKKILSQIKFIFMEIFNILYHSVPFFLVKKILT